jgi:nucleoside-diphosphate-sugar epimerase
MRAHRERSLRPATECRQKKVLPTDIDRDCESSEFIPCDLRHPDEVTRLFEKSPVGAVIHLAALLPSAYHSDPLRGAAVNLTGSLNLLREAVNHRVKRFAFASSLSVYGLSSRPARPFTEDDPATPDEPYGASKRAIELIGKALHHAGAIQFVALRIARVIGPDIKKTNSPWRAQLLDPDLQLKSICIPYAPDAELCLVHVEDAARMLIVLAQAQSIRSCLYNSPSEEWEARRIKDIIEQTRAVEVALGPDGTYAGATCDGNKFAQEFGFRLHGLRERLVNISTGHPATRQAD